MSSAWLAGGTCATYLLPNSWHPVLLPYDFGSGACKPSCRTDNSLFLALEQRSKTILPLSTQNTHCSSRPNVTRPVRQKQRVFRPYMKDFARRHSSLIGFIKFGKSFIIATLSKVPRCRIAALSSYRIELMVSDTAAGSFPLHMQSRCR
ncbi:hypothetical protein PoB_001838900 [Plakobranchus ocellatus]|uniref:Secreted protein n=1 Tax=Plakobranchus ocellatus TaxID=259542 RepID=A0AAV3ZDB3_9GAST|nr:hypothetical protein PoB_001838900 [Plakobranchus ocellatus]